MTVLPRMVALKTVPLQVAALMVFFRVIVWGVPVQVAALRPWLAGQQAPVPGGPLLATWHYSLHPSQLPGLVLYVMGGV